MTNPEPIFKVVFKAKAQRAGYNNKPKDLCFVIMDEGLMITEKQYNTLDEYVDFSKKAWLDGPMPYILIRFNKLEHILSLKDNASFDIKSNPSYKYYNNEPPSLRELEYKFTSIAERDRIYNLLLQTGQFSLMEKKEDLSEELMPYIATLTISIMVVLALIIFNLIADDVDYAPSKNINHAHNVESMGTAPIWILSALAICICGYNIWDTLINKTPLQMLILVKKRM